MGLVEKGKKGKVGQFLRKIKFYKVRPNISYNYKSKNTFNTKMLNFLSTLGADSQFQKNRLLLTKPNYEAPNQQALRNILRTFAGEDEQTRAQIAFATIVKKMHLSNGKENWVYLLKNLIILERVMSDNRFCQELAETNLATVKNYVDRDARSQAVNGKMLVKSLWGLIQQMSRLKICRDHILYYKRSERKTYLDTLGTQQIFRQIRVMQKLFDLSLSLILLTSGISNSPEKSQRQTQIPNQKCKKLYNQFTTSPLAQYLNIHLYSKLLTFFSCQYLCIHKFIQVILHTTSVSSEGSRVVSVEEARVFKKMVLRFKANCGEMKVLVERNKLKKGFDSVDVKEFTAFSEEHILKAVDQYISQQMANREGTKLEILVDLQKIKNPSSHHLNYTQTKFVDKKPLILRGSGKGPKTPRKMMELKKQLSDDEPFSDYFNSYSDEFPHKNMMTIDLIQDIRRDQEKIYQEILYSAQNHQPNTNYLKQQQTKQNDLNFFKQFKLLKTKVKFHDILLFDKEEKQKEEDSTSYSFMNSSRGGSLFDLLNIKWIPQKTQSN